MDITEVRVRLVRSPDERLKAFATVTFDRAFVVRDIKIVAGPSGLFIAMPSRKLVSRCSRCSEKNHLRARYCNGCGTRLRTPRESGAPTSASGPANADGPSGTGGTGGAGRADRPNSGPNGHNRVRLHVDVAHPIHAKCREEIQKAVLEAYTKEAANAPRKREKEKELPPAAALPDAATEDSVAARLNRADLPVAALEPMDAPGAPGAPDLEPDEPSPDEVSLGEVPVEGNGAPAHPVSPWDDGHPD